MDEAPAAEGINGGSQGAMSQRMPAVSETSQNVRHGDTDIMGPNHQQSTVVQPIAIISGTVTQVKPINNDPTSGEMQDEIQVVKSHNDRSRSWSKSEHGGDDVDQVEDEEEEEAITVCSLGEKSVLFLRLLIYSVLVAGASVYIYYTIVNYLDEENNVATRVSFARPAEMPVILDLYICDTTWRDGSPRDTVHVEMVRNASQPHEISEAICNGLICEGAPPHGMRPYELTPFGACFVYGIKPMDIASGFTIRGTMVDPDKEMVVILAPTDQKPLFLKSPVSEAAWEGHDFEMLPILGSVFGVHHIESGRELNLTLDYIQLIGPRPSRYDAHCQRTAPEKRMCLEQCLSKEMLKKEKICSVSSVVSQYLEQHGCSSNINDEDLTFERAFYIGECLKTCYIQNCSRQYIHYNADEPDMAAVDNYTKLADIQMTLRVKLSIDFYAEKYEYFRAISIQRVVLDIAAMLVITFGISIYSILYGIANCKNTWLNIKRCILEPQEVMAIEKSIKSNPESKH